VASISHHKGLQPSTTSVLLWLKSWFFSTLSPQAQESTKM
jgi:hypothetical protein